MPFAYTEVEPPAGDRTMQGAAAWGARKLGIPTPRIRYFEPASPGDRVAFEAPSLVTGRSSITEPFTIWLWAALPELDLAFATRSVLHEVAHQAQYDRTPHPEESMREEWEQEADAFAEWGLEVISASLVARKVRTP